MNGTTLRRLRDFRAPAAFAGTVLLVAGLAAGGVSSEAREGPAKAGTTCLMPSGEAGASGAPSPATGFDSMPGMSHAHGDHPSANPGTGNCSSGGSYATTDDGGIGAGG